MENSFDKFFGLNADVRSFIEYIKDIDWFKNCGNIYSETLEYDYFIDENIETVKKNLIRSNNYAGIVTVGNLFEEGIHRIYCFFYNSKMINLSLENMEKNSWNNLTNKIIEILKEKENVLKIIDGKYYNKFGIKNNISSNIFQLIYSTMIENYCKKIFPNIPTFFEKINKIYIDGHVITGWKGKFPSPYLDVDKPIDNKKGKLIIW